MSNRQKIHKIFCLFVILSGCVGDVEGPNNNGNEYQTFAYDKTEIVTNAHTRVNASVNPFGDDANYDDIAFTMNVVVNDLSGLYLDDLEFDSLCYGIPGQYILIKVKNISELKYANLMLENISLILIDETTISLGNSSYAMSSLGGVSDDPENVIMPQGTGYIIIELPDDALSDASDVSVEKVITITFDIGSETNNMNYISVDEDGGLYVMKMEAELDTSNALEYVNFELGSSGAAGHFLEKITCIITDSRDRPLVFYVLDTFEESIYANDNYYRFRGDGCEYSMDFTSKGITVPCKAYNIHFFVKNY